MFAEKCNFNNAQHHKVLQIPYVCKMKFIIIILNETKFLNLLIKMGLNNAIVSFKLKIYILLR